MTHAIATVEGFSKLNLLSRGPPISKEPSLSLFDMVLARGGGFENLMFLPLLFAFFDGSILFLDVGPFLFVLCISLSLFFFFWGVLIYL